MFTRSVQNVPRAPILPSLRHFRRSPIPGGFRVWSATMAKTVTSPAVVVVDARATAREGFITAAVTDYGAAKVYALQCLEDFGAEFWVKDSKGYAQWETERDTLRDGLKAKGHTNPRQVIRRLIATAQGDKGRGTGEVRGLCERAAADIGKIYTAFRREEKTEGGLSTKEKAWLLSIGKALADNGVDLGALIPKTKTK